MRSCKPAKTGPRACIACRSMHLKCDGKEPCSRCTLRSLQCIFVASRRGDNMKSRTLRGEPAISYSPSNSSTIEVDRMFDQPVSSQRHQIPTSNPYLLGSPSSLDAPLRNDKPEPDPTVLAYYEYIYPSHPFILPQKVYLQNPNVFPAHLIAAIQSLAKSFSSKPPTVQSYQLDMVYQPGVSEDGFKVQTLLVLTILHFACFERDAGTRALKAAVALASKIGAGSNAFHSTHCSLHQESWRRTCAELYTISTLATMFVKSDHRFSFAYGMLVPAPCDGYGRGLVTPQKTFGEMQDRILFDDDTSWSSFAYEIEATRILNTVLDLDPQRQSTASIDSINTSITSFLLSIPTDRQSFLNIENKTDEKMFSALMIINLAAIALHFPRSGLATTTVLNTSCATDLTSVKSISAIRHRAAALKAANEISRMLSYRREEQSISPCFACGIAMCVAVQLPAYLDEKDDASAQKLKEYLQLALIVLNTMGEIWPVAKLVKSQLAQITRETLMYTQRQQELDHGSNYIQPLLTFQTTGENEWLQDLLNGSMEVPMQELVSNSLPFG